MTWPALLYLDSERTKAYSSTSPNGRESEKVWIGRSVLGEHHTRQYGSKRHGYGADLAVNTGC
jgi:hypothetical protein